MLRAAARVFMVGATIGICSYGLSRMGYSCSWNRLTTAMSSHSFSSFLPPNCEAVSATECQVAQKPTDLRSVIQMWGERGISLVTYLCN